MNKKMVEDYDHHRQQSRTEHCLLFSSLTFLPIEDPHQLPENTVNPHMGNVHQITGCKNLPLFVP
jgi:hypothetical protein